MNTITETEAFAVWLDELQDMKGRARIAARIKSAKAGNFGDCKSVGDGVFEMRIDVGPGYRVYYVQDGLRVYLLLGGGDKSSQSKDIRDAKNIWQAIAEERP